MVMRCQPLRRALGLSEKISIGVYEMDFMVQYDTSVLVIGFSGFLFFIQLLVADFISIKEGHVPGTLVEQNHDNFLFRASRAFANSNETVGILVLFILFAFMSSANPTWVNNSAIVYLVGRIGHMAFYYFNLKLLRSVSFVVSALGLLGIFVAGLMYWL
ncbi:MAPEG family protein [Vibrio cholerae]|uniref:MAPEG family protein n=1 Tax=Vibrio cholerae TaxID=666 RepID=UPI002A2424AC|nr:MAPEG family protein [Vibrio cholerae]